MYIVCVLIHTVHADRYLMKERKDQARIDLGDDVFPQAVLIDPS